MIDGVRGDAWFLPLTIPATTVATRTSPLSTRIRVSGYPMDPPRNVAYQGLVNKYSTEAVRTQQVFVASHERRPDAIMNGGTQRVSVPGFDASRGITDRNVEKDGYLVSNPVRRCITPPVRSTTGRVHRDVAGRKSLSR